MLVHDGTKKTKSSCYINHFIYQYYMLVHDGTKKQNHHVISIILYINTTCWFMMELKKQSHRVISIILHINVFKPLWYKILWWPLN